VTGRWVTGCVAAVAVAYAIAAAVLIAAGYRGEVVALAGPVSTVIASAVLFLSGVTHHTGLDTNDRVRRLGRQMDNAENGDPGGAG
jgi:hypothetical protein